MKIKIIQVSIIFLFIVIFLIFYKGLNNSNIYVPNKSVKKEIPYFSVKEFNSNIKTNSDEIFFDDKFYLMNIWASWCVPCREEHVFLMDLSKYKNLTIVGLNYKDNFVNAKNFLQELNNPYKIILTDKNGLISIEWGAYGVPETFLIYDKKILKKFIGPLNKNDKNEIIKLIQ